MLGSVGMCVSTNQIPVANADPDQTVVVDDLVTLDGCGSTDTDADPLTFTWTLIRPPGSLATLSDPSQRFLREWIKQCWTSTVYRSSKR